jgi:hypothetical protein
LFPGFTGGIIGPGLHLAQSFPEVLFLPQSGQIGFRRILFLLSVLAAFSGYRGSSAVAQDSPPASTLQGNITSLSLPTGFAINGKKVAIVPLTTYKFVSKRGKIQGDATINALEIGITVTAAGSRSKGVLTASTIYVLDESTLKIEGFGLIDKVFSASSGLVFRADGYRIRLTPNTATSFSGNLKTLADVNTNVWVKYEGKFDAEGDLVATAVGFYPGKTGARANFTPVGQQEVLSDKNLLDSDGNFRSVHDKFRLDQINGNCGWHWVPVDEQLQHRVARIGASLVPAYQKQLPEDDRARIPFRFYVVKQPDFRFDFGCSTGLILIPEEVVARLKTDDELAAVLADGIAANIEWQSARLIAEYWSIMGLEIAGDAAAQFSGWGLLAEEGADLAKRVADRRFVEQRGRMALALMADAGYDSWAAPEAWRLLAPRKLPGDISKLKYPSRSNYQLIILHQEYRKHAQRGPQTASANPDQAGTTSGHR